MKEYKGSCHCGNVSFSFKQEEITSGIRCNCSICKRKGAVMSPFVIALEDIKQTIKNDSLSAYQFGSNVAKHYFCKKCGIYTFHETMRMPGQCRVNLGCLEDVDIFSLETSVFDGAAL